MYLAQQHTKGITRYIIRQSYPDSDHYRHRDLFDLGTDPTKYIQYPGGVGYYFDPCLEEALSDKGVELAPDELDQIFFQFLTPEIQRVITGFDRSYGRNSPRPRHDLNKSHPIHIFDKRRFHYLRFGHSRQRFIHKVPDKRFWPLLEKSRDELEHYFTTEERRLHYRELWPYVFTIFELDRFYPPADQDPVTHLDNTFLGQLCGLNEDESFLAGELNPQKKLYEHLVRYAILYFDTPPMRQDPSHQYIRDFINRHRIHRPPVSIQIKIKEAEVLFEEDWKTLKRMDKSKLTRIYRRLALKHHPDQGGDAETFRRLTQYYNALMDK